MATASEFLSNEAFYIPENEKLLLLAAEAFYNDFISQNPDLDFDGYSLTADIRTAESPNGAGGANGSKGSYTVYLPTEPNGLDRAPVGGVSGYDNSTFLIYDSNVAVVHEVGHVILGLLGMSTKSDQELPE